MGTPTMMTWNEPNKLNCKQFYSAVLQLYYIDPSGSNFPPPPPPDGRRSNARGLPGNVKIVELIVA